MTAMKKTLLQIVQDILSDSDGEAINTLSGSLEGEQLATIVEGVFYDMIVARSIPEHEELVKLTPASDSAYPTHFMVPENVTAIKSIYYDVTEALVGTGEYKEIAYLDVKSFLKMSDARDASDSNVVVTDDKNGGTKIKVTNDAFPSYWTSFDDYWIIFDSYNSSYDDTLQAHKTRVWGTKFPVFDRFDDGYVPDLDSNLFPYLISESRSRYLDWLQGGTTRKAEESARRNKVHIQNDKHNFIQPNDRNNYGR